MLKKEGENVLESAALDRKSYSGQKRLNCPKRPYWIERFLIKWIAIFKKAEAGFFNALQGRPAGLSFHVLLGYGRFHANNVQAEYS